MESIIEKERIFDLGSLYARFRGLRDSRKARGKRYPLEVILTLVVLAKLCGEDKPSGIAEWAKARGGWLKETLCLKRESMPHRSSYQRILERVVTWEELERLVSEVLSWKRNFGRQVLVAMDGKVLRGTLDEHQNGTYLLAAYLPQEGIVLMQVAIAGQGKEQEAAPRVLKNIDLRGKIVMGDALHTQKGVSTQIVQAGGEYIWLAKGNQPEMEKNIRLWFEPDEQPIPGMNFPRKDLETVRQTCKNHGRLETRTLTVSSQLKDFLDWPDLEQV